MNQRELAHELTSLLQEELPGATITITDRATVGMSQESYFLLIHGRGDKRAAVLRRPSPASSDRSIVTQRRALQSLEGRGVRAPRLLFHRDDADHGLERPFFVMERIDGSVPVGWHQLAPAQRRELAEQAMRLLARLHETPWQETELSDSLAAPGAQPAVAALEWYERRLAKARIDVPPVVEAGLWWLHRHVPEAEQTALIHNDFRMGNLVVQEGRINGVLDWEHVSVGNPAADLTWCFMPVWQDPEIELDDVLDVYEEAAGIQVDPEALAFYSALGYVRLAFYSLMGDAAFTTGRSDDLRIGALRYRLPDNFAAIAASMTGR